MLPEDFFDKFNRRSLDFEKFMERIMNLKNSLKNDDESNLGEPISVETFNQDGYTFEKTTWKTEDGLVTKIEMVGNPFEQRERPIIKERIDEVPLEVQLARAIEEERYEDAAKIRDEIKNNKISLDDLVNDQSINEKDEWNF
jgi:cysteinyl-tRNA synthetase